MVTLTSSGFGASGPSFAYSSPGLETSTPRWWVVPGAARRQGSGRRASRASRRTRAWRYKRRDTWEGLLLGSSTTRWVAQAGPVPGFSKCLSCSQSHAAGRSGSSYSGGSLCLALLGFQPGQRTPRSETPGSQPKPPHPTPNPTLGRIGRECGRGFHAPALTWPAFPTSVNNRIRTRFGPSPANKRTRNGFMRRKWAAS